MKIKNNKIIAILFLFLVWLGLTVWYIIIFDESVLVLSYGHSKESFVSRPEKLLENTKISGSFVAQDENLGIVSLRFEKRRRIPYLQEDIMVFRIKEKNSPTWYYENEYRSGLTYDVPFLPFGFPIISDSKGKTYYFELESLKGNDVNGVVLSEREPILVSKYQKTKAILFNDINKFIDFSYKKFFYSFQTIDIAFSSFVFALPLLFYISWISPLGKLFLEPLFRNFKKEINSIGEKLLGSRYHIFVRILSNVRYYWMIIFLVTILLIDVFFLQIVNDLLYIFVFIFWLYLMKIYNKNAKFTIIVGLLIILIMPISLNLSNQLIAEQAGGWGFIILAAGVFQSIKELKLKKQ